MGTTFSAFSPEAATSHPPRYSTSVIPCSSPSPAVDTVLTRQRPQLSSNRADCTDSLNRGRMSKCLA
ncbi:hypothetical protein HPP92_020239 [Vanilla planifolia]|uniref:Uncharacterized protein n=1 Tax=Vanilla planifolia TaxID=51239 RepID=A0A835Q3A8_VANPL|nr:hypothetical protein HPP92_020239 [Vanilla planifolia]